MGIVTKMCTRDIDEKAKDALHAASREIVDALDDAYAQGFGDACRQALELMDEQVAAADLRRALNECEPGGMTMQNILDETVPLSAAVRS